MFNPFISKYMMDELGFTHPARRGEQYIAFILYVGDYSVSFVLPVAEIRFRDYASDEKWICHISVFHKNKTINRNIQIRIIQIG